MSLKYHIYPCLGSCLNGNMISRTATNELLAERVILQLSASQ